MAIFAKKMRVLNFVTLVRLPASKTGQASRRSSAHELSLVYPST